MDVAAKTMDLSRAVIESLEKGNTMTNAVRLVVQWLARERIDNLEFKYCIDLARGLTYPNTHGLQIQTSLVECEKKYAKVSGLRLIQSGSIGRWMAFDMDYCYMVTTVAAIMTHHEYQFAAEALYNMIVDEGRQGTDINTSYSIQKTRLRPVLSKMVESIALNVVNSGHNLAPLPDEVAGLCVHIASAATFAAVVMAVQNSKNDILIYCNCFCGDILLWLMAHFDGTIELSIAGKVVYEKAFGNAKIRVTILVRETCDPASLNHFTKGIHIEVSLNLGGGQFKTILKKNSTSRIGPVVSKRQDLYLIDDINIRNNQGVLNYAELNDVRLTAQAIANWLLQIPLKPGLVTDEFITNLYFKEVPQEEEQSNALNIGILLQRWPTITHMKFGKKPQTICVFSGPPDDHVGTLSSDDSSLEPPRNKPFCDIIKCFPIALDLFESIKPRCPCTSCRRNWSIGEGKHGCLRETALEALLALLSHTIADGFGASDVSGLVKLRDRKAGLQCLFTDLIWNGLVL